MTPDLKELRRIWDNKIISVAWRVGEKNPIRIRIPYCWNNSDWLKNGPRNNKPKWNRRDKYWEMPRSRFNDIVEMILNRYGKIYILQPYREKEVCATACMNASGFECNCSCMGANHGTGSWDGWFEVNEAFAVRYEDQKFGCRLLTKSES